MDFVFGIDLMQYFWSCHDPNASRIKGLNINSNKALMTILNKGSFWRVGLFGDDALGASFSFASKPDQTDMFSGTKLSRF